MYRIEIKKGTYIMSRTFRIYNQKYIKKTHQYNICDVEVIIFPWNGKIIRDHHVNKYGFPYHPYKQLCMGNCSNCKDHSRDQKHLRKLRNIELRNILKNEL